MPVVALATTELHTVIEDGVSGFVSCHVEKLVEGMQFLLAHPQEATVMAAWAKEVAQQRFGLERFTHAWQEAFARSRELVIDTHDFIERA